MCRVTTSPAEAVNASVSVPRPLQTPSEGSSNVTVQRVTSLSWKWYPSLPPVACHSAVVTVSKVPGRPQMLRSWTVVVWRNVRDPSCVTVALATAGTAAAQAIAQMSRANLGRGMWPPLGWDRYGLGGCFQRAHNHLSAAVRSLLVAAAVNELRILLLGPVELWVGERQAALGGPKQRTLLALLALASGQTVSRDRAAEALWGELLPDGHAQRLHTAVSRLRAALREAGGPPEVIETTQTGYRLAIDPDHVDVAHAAGSLHQARELRSAGRRAEASAAARDALELWRGAPLADLLDNGWAGDHLRRLEDLKLSLLEEEFDDRLTLGMSPGLVEDLEMACASAPLRERLHAQLMLALNATGRRADALHEYDRVRRRLSEELGIDPGAVLREAHHTVLAEEPEARRMPVSRHRRRPTRRGRRGRRMIVIAALFAGAVAATAGVLLADGGPREPRSVRLSAGALVIADPDLRQVRAEIPLSGTIINEQPGGLVIEDGSLWAVTEQGTVTQVDLERRRVVGSTPLALPSGPGAMAVGLGATWVTDSGSATL
ncbi:MAG: hypothetical protein E6G05_13875, partial [Actinobacteria bacterium]